MNQIENRLPIPHSIRARPSSAKQPTMTTAAIPQETDNLPVRQPSDNPDNGSNLESHADSRSSPHDTTSRLITVPDNHPRTAEYQQPTGTADTNHRVDAAWQPKSADWIANRTPIPDPVLATHPDSRPSTRPIPPKPQNTNTPPALGRQSTDTPAIRQPTPAH